MEIAVRRGAGRCSTRSCFAGAVKSPLTHSLARLHVRLGYAGWVDDEAIRSLVTRLARAHPSGGTVIERAAIVAEGAESEAVMTWIDAHGGKPEAAVESSTSL